MKFLWFFLFAFTMVVGLMCSMVFAGTDLFLGAVAAIVTSLLCGVFFYLALSRK